MAMTVSALAAASSPNTPPKLEAEPRVAGVPEDNTREKLMAESQTATPDRTDCVDTTMADTSKGEAKRVADAPAASETTPKRAASEPAPTPTASDLSDRQMEEKRLWAELDATQVEMTRLDGKINQVQKELQEHLQAKQTAAARQATLLDKLRTLKDQESLPSGSASVVSSVK